MPNALQTDDAVKDSWSQVVDIEHIYNEFSGGRVDMRAVRDYMRFLYDRADIESELPRYLLLFGDGHFDFRNHRQLPEPENNWIPPYETVESFHPDRSYTSDDYFGLLDESEGDWLYRGFNVRSTEISRHRHRGEFQRRLPPKPQTW